MKTILVACEQSQIVCVAFRRLGYAAYSCDLLPCYGGHPEWHVIFDAARVIEGGVFPLESGALLVVDHWDLLIAHPPCTMLTHCSALALHKGVHTLEDVKKGAAFFMKMVNAPIPRIAVENPAPLKVANLPNYDQILQPYEFGHKYSKRVCLWLKNLPQLLPMRGYDPNHVQWLKHCAGNPRRRSRTFEGIAEAMAAQWGALL